MKLNVLERLTVLNFMGAIQEEKLAFMQARRTIMEKVGLDAEENEHFKVAQDGENLRWDPERGTEEVEIDLNGAEKAMIVDQLKKLEDEGRVRDEHISLYEKFVEN